MSDFVRTPTKTLDLTCQASQNLLTALLAGEFLAEGTYAAVWRHGAAAFKLTCDPATQLMASLLQAEPVPGLPRVFHVVHHAAEYEYTSYSAIVTELLTPVPARQFAPVRRAYVGCKKLAQAQHSCVVDQSAHLALLMAKRLPEIQTSVLAAADLARVASGLEWLATFMDEQDACADFGARRNWMLSAQGNLVMSDPVVGFIPRLDALAK